MPHWFPSMRAWVTAIVVILLMAGTQVISSYLWWFIAWLIQIFPKAIYIFYLLVTFSPIALIAFIHHWFHQLLDQFFPESRLPDTAIEPGNLPGLISWWQGLYGWLVNQLSTVLSWAIFGLLLPMPTPTSILQFSPWNFASSLNQPQPLLIALLTIRIICAAFFYQFESAVQLHMVATNRRG